MFVEFAEVKIPQFVVADSVGKHVVDGHQDLVGYCHGSALVTPPGFEAIEFVSQVSALGFRRGVGGLYQCGLIGKVMEPEWEVLVQIAGRRREITSSYL